VGIDSRDGQVMTWLGKHGHVDGGTGAPHRKPELTESSYGCGCDGMLLQAEHQQTCLIARVWLEGHCRAHPRLKTSHVAGVGESGVDSVIVGKRFTETLQAKRPRNSLIEWERVFGGGLVVASP
jgi:hypothetical protein